MSDDRVFEKNLWIPTLYLINLNDGKITTTELIQQLRNVLNLSKDDLVRLTDRKDDYFSQIVRNLTASTRSFVKKRELITREPKKNSPLFITNKGKEYLNDRQSALNYLLSNNFKYNDINDNLEKINSRNIPQEFDENIQIYEGIKKITNSASYYRSKKLRDAAIEHFTHNGKIGCDCCSFDFQDFYGEELGKGFIEIHHIKPIFKYEENDLKKTIEEALSNIVPVCSNCHRIIHRGKQDISTDLIKDSILQNGLFTGYIRK